MNPCIDEVYYIKRKSELFEGFDEESSSWKSVIVSLFDAEFAETIMHEARQEFGALIPLIPYIGGDENRLTRELIVSVFFLAFYRVMKNHGKTAEEAGKILFDSFPERSDIPRTLNQPAGGSITEQYIAQRRKQAEISQQRRYPDDWVYDFVVGDGKEFVYGYNFTECAALKFYHTQDADEFMPFYCYLDYPRCSLRNLGFSRTKMLPEGHDLCNHRFKPGRKTELRWPSPFLQNR